MPGQHIAQSRISQIGISDDRRRRFVSIGKLVQPLGLQHRVKIMINLSLHMDGCDQIDVSRVSLKIARKISPWQLIEPGTQPGVCQPVRIPQVNMGIDDALGHMRDPIHLGEPSGHAWARHHSAMDPSAWRQIGLRQRWPCSARSLTYSSLTSMPKPGPVGMATKPSS